LSAARLRLALRLLRAEPPRALLARLADRRRDRRRAGSYRSIDAAAAAGFFAQPPLVLNLLPFPPHRRRGGVALQLLARLDVEAGVRPIALLYRDGAGFRLELRHGPRRAAIELAGGPPADPAALVDAAWTAAIVEALGIVRVPALHVECVAGLPLASLRDAVAAGRADLVLSTPDFALFCPRPHLLEEPHGRFCDYSRDEARCAACLARSWPGAPAQRRRRAVATELLSAAAAVVHASDFMRRRHGELFPEARLRRAIVIPPAVPLPSPPAPVVAGPPRRVAFVGGARRHKGAAVFAEVVERLRLPELRWSAYGGGEDEPLGRLRALGVAVSGYYAAGTLPERLRRDRVDLALLPSICPESHGLALDECQAAGVPVLAFAAGALADRVPALGAGWLIEPAAGAAGLAERLAELATRELPPLPAGASPPTPGGAAAAHLALYRELAAARAGS
jgi:glycosyltransferase involved in cell wall biosynthesis